MPSDNPRPAWGASQRFAHRVVQTLDRFLHIEAVSGAVLIGAALIALVWANSPAAHSYGSLWHLPVTIGVGPLTTTQSLHFVINEGLMTIFFLVAGLEIRRELHEGAPVQNGAHTTMSLMMLPCTSVRRSLRPRCI